MFLQIRYLYNIDREEVRALVNEKTNEVIINGNNYPNYITAKIGSFLLGMKDTLNKEIELEPCYYVKDNETELIKQYGFNLL